MVVWNLDRLALVKRVAVHACRVLGKKVPKETPSRPISKLTEALFALLDQAMAMHPTRFYQDGNFPAVLEACERFLVYVAEEDGHYAGWLAQAFLLVHDLVEESRRGFLPGSKGDVDWLLWASRHPIAASKQAERK